MRLVIHDPGIGKENGLYPSRIKLSSVTSLAWIKKMPSYHYAASIDGGRHTTDGVITTSAYVTTQAQYKEVKKVIAKVFDDFFGKELIVCAAVDPSQVFVVSFQLLPDRPLKGEEHIG